MKWQSMDFDFHVQLKFWKFEFRHFGGLQLAGAALYFAALNQAWPCQSRPMRVTIAPAF
jgi:hypothetical protein